MSICEEEVVRRSCNIYGEENTPSRRRKKINDFVIAFSFVLRSRKQAALFSTEVQRAHEQTCIPRRTSPPAHVEEWRDGAEEEATRATIGERKEWDKRDDVAS
jgi:hypothetical protein